MKAHRFGQIVRSVASRTIRHVGAVNAITVAVLAAIMLAGASTTASAQGPAITTPYVGFVTSANGSTPIVNGLTDAGMHDVNCGEFINVSGSGGSNERADCGRVVLVPGFSLTGGARSCDDYFHGLITEFQAWGYPRGEMTTVGIYHNDVCDVSLDDFGHRVNVNLGNGVVQQINMHVWAGGDEDNHEWVGGPGCSLTGDPLYDWRYAPSSCWSHNKNTPIEHLAYHFGHYMKGYTESVDVIAHSMGGLITQAAHSFSAREQTRPAGIRAPFRSVQGKYSDVMTSGTPFAGINLLNFQPDIGLPGGGSISLDFCRGYLSKDQTQVHQGQCKQLRAGGPFMRNMQQFMTADSAGGRWSVVGSNVILPVGIETKMDIPIGYTTAVAHPTDDKYIYEAGNGDGITGVNVTHVPMSVVPSSKGYYEYMEEQCSGKVGRSFGGASFNWSACWNAGLWAFDGPYPAHSLVTNMYLCTWATPDGLTGQWCKSTFMPRHNRLAFLALNSSEF